MGLHFVAPFLVLATQYILLFLYLKQNSLIIEKIEKIRLKPKQNPSRSFSSSLQKNCTTANSLSPPAHLALLKGLLYEWGYEKTL